MKYYLTLALFLFTFSALRGQNISKKEINYKPINLDEAIIQLTRILPDETKQKILSMTENDFLSNSHLSLGLYIRNNWRLWRGGQLANYFKSKGVFHPDDMSGIILSSFYRHLHGQEMKVEEQIEFYKEDLKETTERIYRLKNDTAFARQEKNKIEYLIRARNEELKLEFPIGTKVKTWVLHSAFGSSQIIGEIVDWQVKVKVANFGSPMVPEFECEYLVVKLKILEYTNIKKKHRIESYNRIKNDELWININSIKKID